MPRRTVPADRPEHDPEHIPDGAAPAPAPPRAAWPALRGALVALLAAVLFGLSTPLVQRFGSGVGSFTTAALLYAGAALGGALLRRPVEREARVRRSDAGRLALMALFGAAAGPVALAWGLQHTGAAGASLMLSLEAVFTALLARLWYHETMDRRVIAAMGLLTLGAMALGWDVVSTTAGPAAAAAAAASPTALLGLLAVLAATACWGVDNTLSRALAERDPGQVVMLKGLLGAAATALLALVLAEPAPTLACAAGLLAVGATGYGLSLRCYLLAQRAFGAARTASVFAAAPFIGAAFAWSLGERTGGAWMLAGAASMAAGVALHLAERHAHDHAHEPMEHEHAHTHGPGHDGHHDHVHDAAAPAVGPDRPHSHPHRHAPLRHAHAHVPDEHHRHRHGH